MFGVSACTESLEQRVTNLVANKNRWLAQSQGRDYRMTTILENASHMGGQEKRTEIRKGKIKRVEWKNGDIDSVSTGEGDARTIRDLFEWIFESLKPGREYDVDATYDPISGYPTRVRSSPKKRLIDAGFTIRVINVEFIDARNPP